MQVLFVYQLNHILGSFPKHMDKKWTIAVVLMMCLAGCMRSVDDNIEVPWCDNDPDLKEIVNMSETDEDMCTTKDTLKNAIVEFVDLMENGPDQNLTTPVGYTMSISELSVEGEVWTYLETTIIGPNGFKLTIEDNYGNDSQIWDIISEGTQLQISHISNGESTQIRMNNTNSHHEIMDSILGFEDEPNDDISIDSCHSTCGECDDINEADCLTCSEPGATLLDEDNDGAGMCVSPPDTYWADQAFQLNGSQVHYDRVMNVSLEDRQTEYLTLREELGMDDPVIDEYTEYYNPLSVEITGFKETDSGMMFPGIISYAGSPYGELEIYADSDFTITGFTMSDIDDNRNFVTFQLISGGDTIVDMGVTQEAIPFMLERINLDLSEQMGILSISMYDIDGDNKVSVLELAYYSCTLTGFTITECQENEMDNSTLAIYQASVDSIDLNMDGYMDKSEFVRNAEVVSYTNANGGCLEMINTYYRYNLSISEADCDGDQMMWTPAEQSEETEEQQSEFTGYWVEYETTNWSCNWEIEEEDGYTYTYWDCQDIRDPPQDTGDNEWHYCEYYDDLETHYCTNGFGSEGNDSNGEWSNSATFTHWRDGTDPRYDDVEEEYEEEVLAYEFHSLVSGLEGDLNDYNLTFANCTGGFTDENGLFVQKTCEPDILSASISYWVENEVLVYVDSDNSGTISHGDLLVLEFSITDSLGDLVHLRLYSLEAGKYSDQNPLFGN